MRLCIRAMQTGARALTRAVVAVVLVAITASTGHAAPWSFELPAGYTEQPGAAEADLAALREAPRTVSADAQVYVSPDGTVRLTRLTWLSRFDAQPTRGGLETMDKQVAAGNERRGARVSESRDVIGDQLVAEQVLDIDGTRVDMRRIYAADRDRVVHMFTLVCAGPADRLADCERAQRSMQLVLPDQAALSGSAEEPPAERHVAALIGQIAGGVLVAAVALWLVFRRDRRRRRQH